MGCSQRQGVHVLLSHGLHVGSQFVMGHGVQVDIVVVTQFGSHCGGH
jgi:hypothetical protein